MPEPEAPRPPPVLVLLGLAALAPALLATLALDLLSWWGRVEWLAFLTLGLGLVSTPWRPLRSWGPSRTGALAVAILLIARCIAGGVSPHARLLVLPAADEARTVDRLFEERDAALLGARLIAWSGINGAPEFPTLAPISAEAYDDMEIELGHRMGSVVLSSVFGHDTGDAFAAYIVEPDGEPRGSVVFLHGYGGNFVLHCWQIAVAARAAHMRTVCPSMGVSGHWSNGHGERIARMALAYARRGEVTILAGLSNGAIGASRLAPGLHDIDALVLVSGADPDAEDPGVPTLSLQGDNDGMTPASAARSYAERHTEHVRYVEMPGTHFLILEQREDVRAAITRFLLERQREGARARAGAP